MIAWMITSCLSFAIVLAGVMAIKALLGKRMSAKAHFLIWGLVALRLLVPFSIESEAALLGDFVAVKDEWKAPQVAGDSQPEAAALIRTAVNDGDNMPIKDTGEVPGTAAVSDAEPAFEYDAQPIGAQSSALLDIAPSAQNASLPIGTVAAWAYAAGVLAFMAILCASVIRARRLVRSAVPVNPALLPAMGRLGSALAIKRMPKVYVSALVSTPAVTGVLRPKLVLPAKLDYSDATLIDHVLAHELTHIAHRDVAVIMLLNVLNALYWFNPLAWLAVCLIRRDMEALADCNALELLGESQRRPYIETLMGFSRARVLRPVATLEMSSARRQLKLRIAAMFRPVRTGAYVRMLAAVLTVALAFAGFTTSCSPAAIGGESPAPGGTQAVRYDAPQRMQLEEFRNESINLSVKVDAEVKTPELDRYPLARVQRDTITEERLDRIVDVLADGKPIYECVGNEISIHLTKAEIEAYIDELQRFLDESKRKDISFTGRYKNEIKTWKEYLAAAPESFSQAVISPGFRKESRDQIIEEVFSDPGGKEMSAIYSRTMPRELYVFRGDVDYRGKGRAHIEARVSDDNRSNSIFYLAPDQSCSGYDRVPTKAQSTVTKSREECLNAANLILERMGLTGFTLVSTYLESEGLIDGLEQPKRVDKYYTFGFSNGVDGLGVSGLAKSTELEAREHAENYLDFKDGFEGETVTISMDDNGLCGFNWYQPMRVIEKEDVQLKPFSEIAEIFKEYMGSHELILDMGNAQDYSNELSIDHVVLGGQPIFISAEEGYRFAPVWNFCGKLESVRKFDGMTEILGGGGVDMYGSRTTYLTIDAVSGDVLPHYDLVEPELSPSEPGQTP